MNQLLIVTVERCSDDLGKHVKLFERQINCDSSVSIPYESLAASFRFIFG